MSDTRPLPLGDAARPAFAEESGYEIGPRIGAGGMGVVHRALDAEGRDCALKLLRSEIAHDPAARARLAREVAALQRVRDPHIAEVLDAELDGDEAFVVTQFIDGPTLEDAVRDYGPLHPEVVREIGIVLGGVLQRIHATGIVHRDLKPSNVMLKDASRTELLEWDADGTEVFPVVIDFGIAQAAEESRLTSTGLVMGTSAYTDPQMLRDGEPTPAVDWWGLAATLAFALTGRMPLGAGAADRVLLRAERGDLDVAGAPPQFRAWLSDALQARPSDRPDPDELLRRLDALDLTAEAEVADEVADGSTQVLSPVVVGDATEVMPAVGADARPADAESTQVLPKVDDETPPEQTEVLSAVRDDQAAPTQSLPRAESAPTRMLPVTPPPNMPPPNASHPAPGPQGPPPTQWPPRPGYPPQQPGYLGQGGYPPPQPVGYRLPPGQAAPLGYGAAAPGPPPLPPPPRRPLLLLGLHVLVTVLGAVAPVVALGALLVGDTVARTWDRVVLRRHRRLLRRGPRRSDTAAVVAASPGHALLSALVSAMALVLPLALGAVTAVLIDIVVRAGGAAPPDGVLTAIVVGVTALFRWWGPGGTELRHGARRTVGAMTGGPAGRTVFTLVLSILMVATVLAAVARGGAPDLFPLRLDGSFDDWAFWR